MSNRRDFLKKAGGLALLTIVPRSVLGGTKFVAPSDQLTKGIIGVGGIGKSSYHFTSNDACRLVAVCDVDSKHLQSALDLGKKRFNETLQSYRDFRRLIANTFNIGNHFQSGSNRTKIGGNWLFAKKKA